MTAIVIEPGRAAREYWRDLWRYRELLYYLAWRDIAVRYKQTAIGVAWALIRPALTLLVFVGFRRMAGLSAAGAVPDPLLVFAAVMPWQFFATGFSEAASSLVSNASLITKVYFPRLIIPCAAVATSLADFVVTLGLLALLLVWYGFTPDWRIAILPLFVLLAFGCAFGAGLVFAVLNVEYRDFRYVIPFIVQFGLFVSPVAFSTANVPAAWRPFYILNPMVGIIDGFRWSLLGGRTPLAGDALAASVAVTAIMLIAGIWFFRRMERRFADVI